MRSSVLCGLAMVVVAATGSFAQWVPPSPDQATAEADTSYNPWHRYPIEGFAFPTSVFQGDTLALYISVNSPRAASYNLDTYNMKDTTAPVYSLSNQPGHYFPLRFGTDTSDTLGPDDRTRKPIDYRLGCMSFWQAGKVSIITSPSFFESGLYFVRLTFPGGGNTFRFDVPFVVKALNHNNQATILYKFPINTYQAYNYWGGASFYTSSIPIDTERGFVYDSIVTMDRPIRQDLVSGLTRASNHLWFIEYANSHGYQMEFCDNRDVDADNASHQLLGRYHMILVVEHDEYWSQDERSNIESWFKTTDHKGNLLFLSANSCYWRIVWQGGNQRVMQCVKDLDPSGIHKPPNNDLWRNNAVNPPTGSLPEASFMGSEFQTVGNSPNPALGIREPPMIVRDPNHWMFRGTTLHQTGDSVGFGDVVHNPLRDKGIIGGEIDNCACGRATDSLSISDTVAQDSVLSLVGHNGITCWTSPPTQTDDTVQYLLHQAIYYEDTRSNARVFNAGTIDWCRGISGEETDPTDRHNMDTITANLLDHFSGKKYIGKVYTDFDHHVTWSSNIELDGNVQVLFAKYLLVSSATVTVDSTFLIDGTLEISGVDTIAGSGVLKVGATGKIVVDDGSSLVIGSGVTLQAQIDGTLEISGAVTIAGTGVLQVDPTGKIIVDDGSSLTLGSGLTLQAQGGASFTFGAGASLVTNGPVLARGSSGNSITFTSSSPNPGINSWNGITLQGGPDTLTYCRIQYAQYGINVQNTSTNFLDHDTVTTSHGGILGMNTSTASGALTVHYCDLSNNNRGLTLSNARADLLQSRMQANNWQGLYGTNATLFLKNSRIQANGLQGLFLSGSTTTGTFSDEKEGPGYNTVYNNDSSRTSNTSEIVLSSGAVANIGDAGFSAWGYNNIYHGSVVSPGQLLIDNQGTETTMANIVYWGDPPYPGTSDFNGPVDYSQYLTSPVNTPAKRVSGGRVLATLSTAGGDSAHLAAWATQLKDSIQQGSSNSLRYLHTLASLLGPGGIVSDALVGGWESFNSSLTQSPYLVPVRELASAYLVQAKLARADYSGALTLATALLSQSPGNHLWFYCQLSTILADLALGKASDAQQTVNTLKLNPQRGDSSTVALMQELVNLKKGASPTQKLSSSAIAGGQNTARPGIFALYQNYPNPFNPTTVVQYDLPEDARVRLTLYDILGREVATLIDAVVPAGYHKAEFNADRLSSGVYFYRLEASATSGRSSFDSLKKLVVLN